MHANAQVCIFFPIIALMQAPQYATMHSAALPCSVGAGPLVEYSELISVLLDCLSVLNVGFDREEC